MKPLVTAELRYTISELQVLKSTLKEQLRAMGYDPNDPDADGVIMESLYLQSDSALQWANKNQDAVESGLKKVALPFVKDIPVEAYDSVLSHILGLLQEGDVKEAMYYIEEELEDES